MNALNASNAFNMFWSYIKNDKFPSAPRMGLILKYLWYYVLKLNAKITSLFFPPLNEFKEIILPVHVLYLVFKTNIRVKSPNKGHGKWLHTLASKVAAITVNSISKYYCMLLWNIWNNQTQGSIKIQNYKL